MSLSYHMNCSILRMCKCSFYFYSKKNDVGKSNKVNIIKRSETMVRSRKRIPLLYICVIFLLLLSVDVQAADDKLPKGAIFIDQKRIETTYMLKDGHLHVPALFFKQMGTFVDWNEQYKAVVLRQEEQMISLPVGTKVMSEYDRKTNTWHEYPLPSKTIWRDKKVFVPLTAVAKQLGMDVYYDPYEKKMYVTTNQIVFQNNIHHGHKGKKLVALTFDDGPDNMYTPQILHILKEKNVRATFFMMGKNIAAYPNEVKRIVQEGHAIGNHTYTHPDLRTLWTRQVINEIESTQLEMAKIVGRKSDLIRPPYGEATKADIAILNELGFRNILWSVDTLDWEGKTKDEILAIVEEQISPGGIILQHNFGSKAGLLHGTVEALPEMIDMLREKGYTFVTVQTLLEQ